jgi:DNA-binding FrmR family transcriptional regulator
MADTKKHKEELLNRVNRIKGQVNAIEKALLAKMTASGVLQTIAACRGAINGLMAEVLEGHVRFHVVDPRRHSKAYTILESVYWPCSANQVIAAVHFSLVAPRRPRGAPQQI